MARFDPVVHPELRIRICAFLMATEDVAFSVLREFLGVSESGLSKQIKVLVDAGYVRATKERGVPRPRTWIGLTPSGRQAIAGHLAALREIAASAGISSAPPGGVNVRGEEVLDAARERLGEAEGES